MAYFSFGNKCFPRADFSRTPLAPNPAPLPSLLRYRCFSQGLLRHSLPIFLPPFVQLYGTPLLLAGCLSVEKDETCNTLFGRVSGKREGSGWVWAERELARFLK